MKLIVHVSDYGWPVPPHRLAGLLADVGGLAEAAGFDGIAVADHLWQHPIMGGPERASLEAYTTLGFLAADTSSARLMTVVTGALPLARRAGQDRHDPGRALGRSGLARYRRRSLPGGV